MQSALTGHLIFVAIMLYIFPLLCVTKHAAGTLVYKESRGEVKGKGEDRGDSGDGVEENREVKEGDGVVQRYRGREKKVKEQGRRRGR